MAGHNKWSQIKRRKGVNDTRRGAVFSKISKEIAIAIKLKGADEKHNFRLRQALSWAKEENMPGENINRAIAKATGSSGNLEYSELVYEGFFGENMAVIVECLSDNKNRTFANIRTIFNKHLARLGVRGSTQHLFSHTNLLKVAKQQLPEEVLLAQLGDNVKDIDVTKDCYFISIDGTGGVDLTALCTKIEASGGKILKLESKRDPIAKITVADPAKAKACISFLAALEADPDVQHIHTNFELSPTLNQLELNFSGTHSWS